MAVSSYTLPRDHADWPPTSNDSVPIGATFPDVTWRIEPRDDVAGPPGAGELLLQGPQVFPGYLHDETEAAAIPSTPSPAQAWYRTGDYVYDAGDGVLVHLGRGDGQVKIGGYRVEINEVESHLRRLPGVVDAVVTTVRSDGELVLCAFYLGQEMTDREIKATLSVSLPHYMVPRQVTRLTRFPLTTSGKTDREAIRAAAEVPV